MEVWIVDPYRGNLPNFNRQMADLGFDRHEHQLGGDPPNRLSGAPAYKGRLPV